MKKSTIVFFSLLTGVTTGAFGTAKIMDEKAKQSYKLSDKYRSLFLMMNQWVKVKQEGKNLASYFEQKGYKEIAIYGMGYAGRTLMNELAESTLKVKYGIDQNRNTVYEGTAIFSPEDKLEVVDAIVVTPITFFTEIEEHLSRKIGCVILSLEDILYEI